MKILMKKIIKTKIIISLINSRIFNSYKKSKDNRIILKGIFFHCNIKIKGRNNIIIVYDNALLQSCSISIYGNNNSVYIGKHTHANELNLWIEDDNNKIEIGDYTTFQGLTKISCIEGTSIIVGKDCMFSSNISLATGDSHSILDYQGIRINSSKDIYIGNHVWVCKENTILKGTKICDNSIIGARSLVTKIFSESNVIIAGIPAKIIKAGVNWKRERI